MSLGLNLGEQLTRAEATSVARLLALPRLELQQESGVSLSARATYERFARNSVRTGKLFGAIALNS
jgi:hypothetical protein